MHTSRESRHSTSTFDMCTCLLAHSLPLNTLPAAVQRVFREMRTATPAYSSTFLKSNFITCFHVMFAMSGVDVTTHPGAAFSTITIRPLFSDQCGTFVLRMRRASRLRRRSLARAGEGRPAAAAVGRRAWMVELQRSRKASKAQSEP